MWFVDSYAIVKLVVKIAQVSSVKLAFAVIGLLFISISTADAGDEANSPAGLAVYSDINFIETEREFMGLQVTLVPYNDGQKSHLEILWRSAGPFLNKPLLLDAVQIRNSYKVVVPEENSNAGKWTLSLKGNFLYAVGPGSSKFSLKKIFPKWILMATSTAGKK